jgi:putative MFS transporter
MRAWFAKDGVLSFTVLVAALGYFVEQFDLMLVGALRVPSLTALGIGQDGLMDAGLLILNSQLAGMVVGGLLWGVIGDRKGRVYAMFGSILLYSLASIANAFVTTVEQYMLCRFIGGIGLAGELGVAVTLISEALPKEKRGYAAGIMAGVGCMGLVLVAPLAKVVPWDWCYIIGGVMGLALLVFRIKMFDSGMFQRSLAKDVARGRLVMLVHPKRLPTYLASIFLGLPVLYIVWVCGVFAPELGRGLELAGPVDPLWALTTIGGAFAVGDICAGLLSGWWRTRKKVVLVALVLSATALVTVLSLNPGSPVWMLYALYGVLGFVTGYWALCGLIAAEQFGTNLRATAATSATQVVRVPLVIATTLTGSLVAEYGVVQAVWWVGLAVVGLGLLALLLLQETHGKDLDYLEH